MLVPNHEVNILPCNYITNSVHKQLKLHFDPLQRRYNVRDGSSNQRRLGLSAQPFVQAQIKENIKAPSHLLLWAKSNGDSPHKGPVTRKTFPFKMASSSNSSICCIHDDVIKWKHFPRYWPFVRGIHRSPVNSPHKGQWCGALMFSLICTRINGWVNNGEAGDLRRHRAHYDVTVMCCLYFVTCVWTCSHVRLKYYIML